MLTFFIFLLFQYVLTAAGVASVHPAEQRQHVQQQRYEPQQRVHGHEQHGPDGWTDERHVHGHRAVAQPAPYGARTGNYSVTPSSIPRGRN